MRNIDRETRRYWQQQRKAALKRDRATRLTGDRPPVTMVLMGLMVLGWLVSAFAPGLLERIALVPGGQVLILFVSAILPGGLLSLVLSALFVWMIGSQIESTYEPWQYVLVFFGSGAVGAALAGVIGGFGIGYSFAAFGLAGAYVRVMSRFAGGGASTRWALALLLINVFLSGFQPVVIAGMGGAFFSGLGIAAVLEQAGR